MKKSMHLNHIVITKQNSKQNKSPTLRHKDHTKSESLTPINTVKN